MKRTVAALLVTIASLAHASPEGATKAARLFVESQLSLGKPNHVISLTSLGPKVFMEFDMRMRLDPKFKPDTLKKAKHEFCWRDDMKEAYKAGMSAEVSLVFSNETLRFSTSEKSCGL